MINAHDFWKLRLHLTEYAATRGEETFHLKVTFEELSTPHVVMVNRKSYTSQLFAAV